jgi:hypothetical protein
LPGESAPGDLKSRVVVVRRDERREEGRKVNGRMGGGRVEDKDGMEERKEEGIRIDSF